MSGESGNSNVELLASRVERPIPTLLREYCRRYLPYLFVSLFTLLVGRALYQLPPVIVGVLFDSVLTGGENYTLPLVPAAWIPTTRLDQFLLSVGVILGAYTVGTTVQVVGGWAKSWVAYEVQHDLRTDAYAEAQRLSFDFHDTEGTGRVLSVLNNDVNAVEQFFSGTLQRVANTVFLLAVIAGYMLLLSWQLTVLVLVVPVLVFATNHAYSRFVEPRHREIRGRVADITAEIEDNVNGIDVLKTYTREQEERERITEVSDEYRDANWAVSKVEILTNQWSAYTVNLGYIVILGVGGFWVLRGPPGPFTAELSAGTVLTFLLYTNRLQWPLSQITSIVDEFQQTKATVSRVLGIVNHSPSVANRDGAHELTSVSGAVSFDEVTFTYPDAEEPALRDVSLDVDPGDTVGIVGPTGSGKSTLVKLLVRFYDVEGGTVSVDGHDVRDVTIRSLRRHVGYVGQSPFLFDTSVAENIAYSDPTVDREEVVTAAKRAGAHEFVTDLPDGYDTQVGSEGAKLSGGQRQRISIARAILSDPEILVLDEATSHVDNETKTTIQRNLASLTADRTTLTIAHNLSTVRGADEIAVLEDGEIVERGSHDELADNGGLYERLWETHTGEVILESRGRV
ncbi:ABC transporter ATP-binding protein [Halobaculum sp. MBLA0147]|uniref:ABC transporter ATP-binding protein n=1 Tax=Halobaculum sp. MBLA0147 TaxID=3079934 RepID=UPI003525ED3E